MMRWCAVLLMLVAPLSWASERLVSVQLDDVPLVELFKLSASEFERKPFVLLPEFQKAETRATLRVLGRSPAEVAALVRELVERAEFSVEDKAGVLVVGKRREAVEDVEVYRPKYRAASYLLDALAPFFKPGAFGHQRGVAQVAGAHAQSAPAGASAPVQDSGQSAYSVQDRKADVIVFKGSDLERVRFLRLAGQLDTRPPELLVKAVVYEVSADRSEGGAVGLAASLLGGKLGLKLGGAITAGDWSGVWKSASLSAVYSALETDSRFKVVSAPRLRVVSGQSARLVVGTDTPVLGAVSQDRNGNPIQSVEYKPSGVILELRPDIHDDVAELLVTQQISNFIPTTNGVSGSPTLIKRELSTSVAVGSDVLVLGGLDEDKSSASSSGPSWLPPFLQSRRQGQGGTEILLLLQAERI